MSGTGQDRAVGRRLVLILPGFEPVSLEAHCRRFRREGARTAPAYGVRFDVGEPRFDEGACGTASFTLRTGGRGWETLSDIVLFDLARLNALYDAAAWPVRLLRGFRGAFDLLASGAPRRYFRDGWRFLLFFLVPFLVAAAMLALPAVAVVPAALGGASQLAWSLPLALLGAAGMAWLGRRIHLLLMMDLWGLTADVARRRRPDVQSLLDAFASEVARRIAESDAEEVIVAAHSFGVVPAVMALADPRAEEVALHRYVGLLATGSYLLAVAHHGAADALRATARRVLSHPFVWIDVQAQTDLINFFGTNPVDALGAEPAETVVGRPLTLFVRFRDQLMPQSYRALRGDFFRTHRQFVYGVERRSHYALFAVIGGPERFADVAARSGLLGDWTRFSPPESDGRAAPDG